MEKYELNLTVKDFPNICRICLRSEDFKPLEDSKEYSKTTDTLKTLTGIEMSDDDRLPKNICDACTKQLSEITTFVELCKQNDSYLKTVLEDENKETTREDYDSFDELDNTVLSERKIKLETDSDTSVEEKHFSKSKKRLENCECKVCGKKFTRRGGLKRHSKIHSGVKPYECQVCGKTFVERATLNRHCLIHTGEKPFECNLCGKTTSRKDQILDHVGKHHPNAVDCDFVITEHKRTEIAMTKNVVNKVEPVASYCTDPSSDDEFEVRQFKTKKRVEICLCNLCGKVFRRRGYLKNHMAIHAKIKPFVCKICGKGFTQRHVLTRHNLVHTKERPFQCNLCGKTFTRKEILMDHLKNHEEGKKPYLCFHCGKCFSNKDYLSKHLKYYLPGNEKRKAGAEEKKCMCPQCGKQLHSASYLKTHLLTHTGEKPYECNICGHRFTVLRSLNHHLNIHKGVKPYQCNQCDKAFRTSSSLKKHALLHTGERPFKCTSCEKGFIRRSHLKRHLRLH